jgi:starch-binding outer membrane protein, SusD/RagB family
MRHMTRRSPLTGRADCAIWRRLGSWLTVGAGALALGACTSDVKNYNAITQPLAPSSSAVQTELLGTINGLRLDWETYIWFMNSFSRDANQWQSTNPEFTTEGLGTQGIAAGDFYGESIWNNEFSTIVAADTTVATVNTLTTAQLDLGDKEFAKGAARTFRAISIRYLIDSRDTAGVPVYGPEVANAPFLCKTDALRALIFLLDSAYVELDSAETLLGATPPVITLPTGFSSNGAFNTPAGFIQFNRALAAQSDVELAYAYGLAADSVSPAAHAEWLDSALASLSASFFVDGGSGGGAPLSDIGVYMTWSGNSGDQSNPLANQVGTQYLVQGLIQNTDTLDARWIAKITPNPAPPEQSGIFALPLQPGGVYSSIGSNTPIIRNEELVLLAARAYLGLGNTTEALHYVNTERTNYGGYATDTVIATATGVRDYILYNSAIGFIYEGAQHLFALRDYKKLTQLPEAGPASAYTNGDFHPGNLPVPLQELNARNLTSVTLTCSNQ